MAVLTWFASDIMCWPRADSRMQLALLSRFGLPRDEIKRDKAVDELLGGLFGGAHRLGKGGLADAVRADVRQRVRGGLLHLDMAAGDHAAFEIGFLGLGSPGQGQTDVVEQGRMWRCIGRQGDFSLLILVK